MNLSDYEAKRSELDAQMQKLNEMESEKKMEYLTVNNIDCKETQRQDNGGGIIGEQQHETAE